MSADWDSEDLARLIALERTFSALALISASNFAYLANTTPSNAVAQFRAAAEGGYFDKGTMPASQRDLIRSHVKRLFDHVAEMAKHADLGAPKD